jgi:hypothetical protein
MMSRFNNHHWVAGEIVMNIVRATHHLPNLGADAIKAPDRVLISLATHAAAKVPLLLGAFHG